ncbi:MAG: protein-disulfide reductase DsbD family protein [Acidobacteriota bacterium]
MTRWFLGFLLLANAVFAEEAVFSVAQAGWERRPQPGGEAGVVALEVRLQEGWHVNPPNPSDPYLIPTRVELQLPQGWEAGEPQFPQPKKVKLEVFEQAVELFEGSFWVRIPVKAPAGAGEVTLTGFLEAQACNNLSCLPPKKVAFSVPWGAMVSLPVASTANAASESSSTPQSSVSERFAGASLLLQLVLVFLGGLALNLTPCVYPIIPVTVGFFLNQTGSSKRTALLASFYVLGMAVTYSTLGVVAALTGKLFGAALQKPWVTGGIVVVVLALAASMFGLWEIRIPAWVSGVAGARQGVVGSLVMGLVVGLVAAPCIGPFVLGLLAYVGQKQSVMLGFLLFFTLALGLGLPYLFLALSTRSLEKLPHSGAWMEGVRQLFGVLLVALAFYFARPLLPGALGDKLLALSLVLGGFYLAVIARPGYEIAAVDRFMRAVTLALVLAGAWLWPHPATTAGQELSWEKANAQVLQEAIAQGGPVIVDFYADWCLPCKELDEKTFSRPEVKAELASFRRLKVDLTQISQETEELRKAYGVAGVPTVLFFYQGREAQDLRLTGFEGPEEFLRRVRKLVPAGSPAS